MFGELTNPQSQNGYSYANNNPIIYSDPSGLWTIDINLSMGFGISGFTTGLLVSDTGLYSYSGAGLANSPLPSGGIYVSPDNPTSGVSMQGGAGYIFGGSISHNYTDNSNSWEFGIQSPGYGVYTVVTSPLKCF